MPDMATLTQEEAARRPNALYELKIDGSRMSYMNDSLVSDRLINRNARYAHILKEVRGIDWEIRGEIAIPGGNNGSLNKNTWKDAKYFIFDLYSLNGRDCSKLTARERRIIISSTLMKHKFQHLTAPIVFDSFKEGWEYVVENQAEGIVTKDPDGTCWKTKLLKEEKLKIVDHVAGKAKGAFLIERQGIIGKVSGTSVDFLGVYAALHKAGKDVYAEIEYAYITDSGKPFQPRLRRIGTLEDLKYT